MSAEFEITPWWSLREWDEEPEGGDFLIRAELGRVLLYVSQDESEGADIGLRPLLTPRQAMVMAAMLVEAALAAEKQGAKDA